MMEYIGLIGASLAIGGVLVGYGELRGRVRTLEQMFELIRADIKHLDSRVEDLTDFLLREAHGEVVDKIRNPNI